MRSQDGGSGLSADQAAAADSGVKALIPIDRPFLDYVLAALVEAGYRRVCLVIGPNHDALRRYYGQELEFRHLQLEFAVQAQPRGTADALKAAASFVGDDPFLMLNSDNYYPVGALEALRHCDGPGLAAFEREGMLENSNIPAPRLSKFAVVKSGDDGFLERIIEKPDSKTLQSLASPLGVSMNCWRFDSRIFAACDAIGFSERGELELPDAVQYACDHLGVNFKVVLRQDTVLDLSSREDIGPVSRLLAGTPVSL
jgi:dTDP-glucose pyrophosphorylase